MNLLKTASIHPRRQLSKTWELGKLRKQEGSTEIVFFFKNPRSSCRLHDRTLGASLEIHEASVAIVCLPA